MRKFLSLLVGAAVSLGATGQGVATPPARSTATTRALALVPLDLSSKGMPLIIDVPAGTTATKVSDGPEFVQLAGPGFRLTVWPGEYADSKSVFETRRDMDKEEHAVAVNEPTAYRYKGDEQQGDHFGVLIGGPKQKMCFTIFSANPEKMTDSPFTAEQSDLMFAAAKGARLKLATPAAQAPVKKK